MKKPISVFQGGVDALPFSGVQTTDEALAFLGQAMHPDEFKSWILIFCNRYEMWYEAFRMVETRFHFYLRDALPNRDLYDKIGTRERELRLVLAMHCCIMKAEEIKRLLDGMVDEFLAKCSRKVRCRIQGIEPFDAKPRDFTASKCEATGVCTCENRGAVPPYMDGCPGDTTLLRRFEEPYESSLPKNARLIVVNR
jgi:hypothetical protein